MDLNKKKVTSTGLTRVIVCQTVQVQCKQKKTPDTDIHAHKVSLEFKVMHATHTHACTGKYVSVPVVPSLAKSQCQSLNEMLN